MIDTNIIVSAMLFPKGKISAILKEIVQVHNICICTFAVEELQMVVDRKFPSKVNNVEMFLNELSFELIYTPKNLDHHILPYIRDEKDYPILASAISADVDVLLSGDKDLLTTESSAPKFLMPNPLLRNTLISELSAIYPQKNPCKNTQTMIKS